MLFGIKKSNVTIFFGDKKSDVTRFFFLGGGIKIKFNNVFWGLKKLKCNNISWG